MDQLDHQIVELLLTDGRATYKLIGDTVGLSVAAAKRRVDRLVASQVIHGFAAVVDPHVLGWSLEAHVELFTNGTVPFDTMREDLLAMPEVVEAFTVAGAADAFLRLVGLNNDEMQTLFIVILLSSILGIAVSVMVVRPPHLMAPQVVALLIMALGAWIDSTANDLTAPARCMSARACWRSAA